MVNKVYINAKYRTEFPALLKMGDAKLLETGTATVSVENRSVDFTGDFVPLFKMGERVIITRLFGNREIHHFYGEIYISSQKLLRITNVRDELPDGSESVYLFPINMSGKVTLVPEEFAQEPRRRFRRKPEPQTVFEAAVNALTIDTLEFSSKENIPPCQRMQLTVEYPVKLESLPLTVNKVLEFGSNGKSYMCRIDQMPPECREKWELLIKELHIQCNKLF